MTSASLHAALTWQSKTCASMGAPLTAEILRLMVDDPVVSAAFHPMFAPISDQTPRALLTAAYPLRVLGALHFLVLSGRAPRLAALYALGGGADLAGALAEASRIDPRVIDRFMASPPQTNEVRRSLALFGGFLTVAAQTGLPLRCLELGASAGLNANWDRYDYDLGALGRWGAPTSPVKLSGDWTGGAPPLDAVVQVQSRAACDQNPVDISDDGAAARLLAYIWPDQPERLARARAAIALARETGVTVEKADAADWLSRHGHPQPGVATVVYHSSFIQYPPPDIRSAILSAISKAGAGAWAEAPFAWLRKEPAEGGLLDEVRLTLWPGGEDRLLATAHAHGANVQWLAPAH
jgi:hypothetical protein